MMPLKRHNLAAVLLLLLGGYTSAQAAIAPDRTRLVFRGEDKSISVDLKNANDKLPYLAQSWMEDEKGNKIDSPLTAVPPVQRIEASGTGQIKIQGIPALASLPQDRETLFYYNVREIPPKSDKPNTLQIALQTRIKVFIVRGRCRKSICSIPGSTRSLFSVKVTAIGCLTPPAITWC